MKNENEIKIDNTKIIIGVVYHMINMEREYRYLVWIFVVIKLSICVKAIGGVWHFFGQILMLSLFKTRDLYETGTFYRIKKNI